MERMIHAGDAVYLYEADRLPIGKVRAVRREDLVVDLADGGEYELSLECVESAVDHRVLLAAHRIDPDGRERFEQVRKAVGAAPA